MIFRSESDLRNHPARSAFLSKHHAIFSNLICAGGVAFVVATAVMGFSTGSLDLCCLATIAIIVAIIVTYPLKLLPGSKALKSIPGVKLLQIGGCTALLVILIAQAGGVEVTSRVMQLALALGCFNASTGNLRDVRDDIEGDKHDGIKTLAVLLGPRLAWALSVTLSLTSVALLLSLQSSGASVTAAFWVYMALTWSFAMGIHPVPADHVAG